MHNCISPAGDNRLPKAIEAIIKELESMSNIHRNSVCEVLHGLIQKHMGQNVVFHSKSSEHRRFPQISCRWYQKNIIEVRIFTSQADSRDPTCDNMLRQLSVASILVGTPANFVDELDPDKTPPIFRQKYSVLAVLSDRLFDVLSNALVIE